jgi:hypothetical protein
VTEAGQLEELFVKSQPGKLRHRRRIDQFSPLMEFAAQPDQ